MITSLKTYTLKHSYSHDRMISNYLERITLSDLSHMMIIVDSVVIDVETLRRYSGCSLEKGFSELIHMNP